MDKITFTEKEKERIEQFRARHRNCPQYYLGKAFFSTTGGQYTFIITPTGLGNVVRIKCNVCDTIEDITDDNW